MYRNSATFWVRATVVALALTMIALVAPKALHAQALTPLRVQHYQGLLINQSSYVALYGGFFKKHGLDVTLVPLPSGPAVEAALHAGSIDIGTQDLDQTMINTHLDNLNFKTICGAEGSYYQVVVSPGFKDKLTGPLTYPAIMKNFVGKRLGVTALGADTNYYWNALFEGAGLSPDAGTYVGIGVGQTNLSAVQHNQVDATMGFEPLTTIEAQSGGKVAINIAKGEGPPLTRDINPQLTYFATGTWLQAHPDTASAFNAAIQEAVKFQQNPKNFPQVLDYVKQALGPLGDAKGFDKMVKDNIVPSSSTAITPRAVKAWLEFTKEFIKFPKDVTPDEIYKEVIWDKACK